MTNPGERAEPLTATCQWCGVSLVAADGVWTEPDGTGDYCPEGLAVDYTGVSPHLPVLAARSDPEPGEGLREAAQALFEPMDHGSPSGPNAGHTVESLCAACVGVRAKRTQAILRALQQLGDLPTVALRAALGPVEGGEPLPGLDVASEVASAIRALADLPTGYHPELRKGFRRGLERAADIAYDRLASENR